MVARALLVENRSPRRSKISFERSSSETLEIGPSEVISISEIGRPSCLSSEGAP